MQDIVLLGNPNTGKTTLFNTLTKSSQHTGNWHGVTVDSKNKTFKFNDQKFNIVDLPGVYSLTALSFEEQVSLDYLFNNQDKLVINIVDINNIYRNLYLTMELIQLGVPMILVINQTTKIQKSLYNINTKKLEKKLNIKVLKINAENIKEVNNLKQEIYNFYNQKNINQKYVNNSQSLINKGNENIAKINNKYFYYLQKTINLIKNNQNKLKININFLANKCLEGDTKIIRKLQLNNSQLNQLKTYQNDMPLEEIISYKFAQIDELFNHCKIAKTSKVYGKSKLDKFVLNKYLSLPIFCGVLLLIFYFTFFSVGSFLSEKLSYFVENVFGEWLLGLVKSCTNSVIIYDFFSTAIIGGLGSVFSFLPQVVILFLCLGLLEDSGYLSRVAFSLDDIFSKVGLSGKSVYTLLMGFGCSTSACLTARTMEDKNSKIKTAILAPYMSCSAKLPIYVVIGSAFFGASNVFVIFALYMLGVVVALLLSVFFDKTFLKSKEQSFVLEFPPYRLTKPKRLLKLAWDNIKLFLIRIGSILVSVNIIIWVLSSFSFDFKFVLESGGQSMLQTLGHILTPIFAPLGFGTWGATSALLAGLIAKEIIVSSIAMFNGISPSSNMQEQISRSLTNPANVVFFTPASAISYMVFCLLYSPCFATISVLSREIGKKWTFISCLVQLVVAYLISLILYTSINLILNKGILTFLLLFLFIALLTYSLALLLKKKKSKCAGCKRS